MVSTLHQVGQVGHLGALIGEDGPVRGGQRGPALQGVLGHVPVLRGLPVHLQAGGRNAGVSPLCSKTSRCAKKIR
ncbi:hypothetical protein EYF80_016204 [Liparis tanakae]|uniref:Uncharacterized protein n=1 Tax=Liparis tanakae TaxID=230148 RepID=A0A4Z2I6C9_9TELE|nr:hypothetical protein EYF80_016204 [Liparis tanakae]